MVKGASIAAASVCEMSWNWKGESFLLEQFAREDWGAGSEVEQGGERGLETVELSVPELLHKWKSIGTAMPFGSLRVGRKPRGVCEIKMNGAGGWEGSWF
jgi:hypothetical protein